MSGSAGLELVEEQRYEWDLFWAPVVDVAERTPAGEKRTEQVYVRDYFAFYPLVRGLGRTQWESGGAGGVPIAVRFFPHPGSGGPLCGGHRGEGEDGQVYSVDMNTLTGGDGHQLQQRAVEGGCYFTLNCISV